MYSDTAPYIRTIFGFIVLVYFFLLMIFVYNKEVISRKMPSAGQYRKYTSCNLPIWCLSNVQVTVYAGLFSKEEIHLMSACW